MGVSKLLKAGIENEEFQLHKINRTAHPGPTGDYPARNEQQDAVKKQSTETVPVPPENKPAEHEKAMEAVRNAEENLALAKDNVNSSIAISREAKKQLAEAREKANEISGKKPLGRKPNKEKGLKGRRQYTITLAEEDYETFYQAAVDEGLSLAKFLERAAREYLLSHNK